MDDNKSNVNEMSIEERKEILNELRKSYKYYSFLKRVLQKIKKENPDWKNIENYTDEQLKYLLAARKCETYIQMLHGRFGGSSHMNWYFALLKDEEKLNSTIEREKQMKEEQGRAR